MTLAQQIYRYSEKIMKKGPDDGASDAIKKRIVDSIFVSYGAKDAAPVKIAKSALLPSSGRYNSGIYFTEEQAAVDTSAFINGCMTRYLDYNDTYLTKKEFAHPSDNIPPLLCLADAIEEDCSRMVKAIYLAYQVQCAFSDAASLRDHGWDHVVYLSASVAAGAAGLLGLDENGFANAINLGLNNNIAMRQVRAGELSMWKGCTAANASRNSVFAALLAKDGMTGPSPIFEGEMGFFKQVTGNFSPDLEIDHVCKTMIKNHPVEYNAMSGVDAALKLKDTVKGEIKKVGVETSSVIYKTIVKDPEKLRPKTRETADHSLPYIIAYTMLYGAPTPDSYSRKYLSDKKILDIMDKMELKVTDKFDSMYPEYVPARISVSTTKGEFAEEVTVPKGHFKDPYSWDDLKAKGLRLVKNEAWVGELINIGKGLEHRETSEIFEVMASVDS